MLEAKNAYAGISPRYLRVQVLSKLSHDGQQRVASLDR